jgi:hypothetical protein
LAQSQKKERKEEKRKNKSEEARKCDRRETWLLETIGISNSTRLESPYESLLETGTYEAEDRDW